MKTAIQILDEMIEEQKKYDGRPSSLISQRISALEDAKERIQKETGWISVEEKEPDGVCIAFGGQNEMLIGYCGNEYGDWTCEGDNMILEKVTHWMPLPLPPNE